MTPADLLFAIISCIALVAIGISFYLLRQRRKLRRGLVSVGCSYALLEATNAGLREELHLMRLREQALIRHGNQLIDERNLLRAQLVACTEAPKFGIVRRGNA